MLYKNILKLIVTIGMGLSATFLLPIAIGVHYGEHFVNFLIFDAIFFLTNFIFYLFVYNHKVILSIKEGILSVNLIWILLGIAGGTPLYLYSDVSVAQAFFEAISGFTTTGATIYTDIEALPKMILMHRSLMHWIGGIGIVVLSVGLLSLINPNGSLTLFKAESTGIKLEKITPKIKDTAISIWNIYLLITAACAFLLILEGMSFFDAINHAFSTISTGGFSTKNASIGYFAESPYILWTLTFFMFISGINFLAHLKLVNGDTIGYKSEEFVWYSILFVIISVVLAFIVAIQGNMSWFAALTHASFNVISVLTTTGFASLDYELWGPFAVTLIFIAMLVGGNAGSTSGGIKVIRFVLGAKLAIAEIKKILHPNAIINVYINQSTISSGVISATFGFFLLFILTNAVVVVYLFSNGYDALTAISTAIACVGNVGPGFGKVGPAQNYAFFSSVDLGVLSVAMIIGRLEIYTFFLIFIPRFWKKF
ncbi:MAG: TrkH family potassium uptake protein [Sulfurospirillum sp.]|nr:TrkH family potassium uptake protein [Sulfurospirillum sp.]